MKELTIDHVKKTIQGSGFKNSKEFEKLIMEQDEFNGVFPDNYKLNLKL